MGEKMKCPSIEFDKAVAKALGWKEDPEWPEYWALEKAEEYNWPSTVSFSQFCPSEDIESAMSALDWLWKHGYDWGIDTYTSQEYHYIDMPFYCWIQKSGLTVGENPGKNICEAVCRAILDMEST